MSKEKDMEKKESVLSNSLNIKYDTETESIQIFHPDPDFIRHPMVHIRKETYSKMDYDQLCHFLGSRFVLLMPGIRAHYQEELERLQED